MVCSSNSPQGPGAFRPGLSLAFGQMTCGVLLESSGESELRSAIWRMKGLIPWGDPARISGSNGSGRKAWLDTTENRWVGRLMPKAPHFDGLFVWFSALTPP